MQVCFTGATKKWFCSAQLPKPIIIIAQLSFKCFSPIGSHILYPWLSFYILTVYSTHHSAATKLALAPVSINTLSLIPSNSTLITGILSILLSSAAHSRFFLFRVVVHLGFWVLKLTLSLEEAILGAIVTSRDLKMIFFSEC